MTGSECVYEMRYGVKRCQSPRGWIKAPLSPIPPLADAQQTLSCSGNEYSRSLIITIALSPPSSNPLSPVSSEGSPTRTEHSSSTEYTPTASSSHDRDGSHSHSHSRSRILTHTLTLTLTHTRTLTLPWCSLLPTWNRVALLRRSGIRHPTDDQKCLPSTCSRQKAKAETPQSRFCPRASKSSIQV